MSITTRERNAPTQNELEELLGMLLAANEEGQLVSITFMLQDGPNTMVDHRGSQELTELACRTVRQRIGEAVGGQTLLGRQILESNTVLSAGKVN
ncbi:MAG: hypothetical protein ACREO4_06200 [Lysobacter sp.]